MEYQRVLDFWFGELSEKQWFSRDRQLDARIQAEFLGVHSEAVRGELFEWRADPGGRLAEIIVIDQFSRNIFRDDPRSFQYDSIALVLAQEAVRTGAGGKLPIPQRAFLYLPYMHSESSRIHLEAVKLFDQPGLEMNLDFERMHKAIVDRFGRYPHRNALLGRKSTAEEKAFLEEPNSSF